MKNNGETKKEVVKQHSKQKKRQSDNKNSKVQGANGFARGLKAERIIGATNDPGEMFFLMKWVGSDEADLVPAKHAYKAFPQIVIKYYEERINWRGGKASLD